MNEPMDPQRLTQLLSSAVNDLPTEGDPMNRIGQGISRRRTLHQTLAIGGTSLAVVAVLVFAFILRPGNSTTTPPPVGQSSTPTPSVTPSPTPTQPVATHPLPKGFNTHAVSARGQAWWVLGDSSIEFTNDGGQTFETRPTPSGWRSLATGDASGVGIAYVDGVDGILWSPGHIWKTSDGGFTWQDNALTGSVVSSARNTNAVYLLISTGCGSSGPPLCGAKLTTYSSGTGLVDHNVQMPTRGEQPRSVSVAGATIFILALDGSGAPGRLLKSTDSGATFTSLANGQGCLTGSLDAYSDLGVYEICVSGTSAHLLRSVDGGKTFSTVNVHTTTGSAMGNCASMVAKDVDTVVLSPGDGLVRTTNGFASSTQVPPPAPGHCAQLLRGGPTDQLLALESSDTGQQLWVSADAGQTWRQVLRAQ